MTVYQIGLLCAVAALAVWLYGVPYLKSLIPSASPAKNLAADVLYVARIRDKTQSNEVKQACASLLQALRGEALSLSECRSPRRHCFPPRQERGPSLGASGYRPFVCPCRRPGPPVAVV